MAAAPTVLIMGPPGAGKGTQAAHLVVAYDLAHLSTGDLLRAAVAAGTDAGQAAQRYMDAGDLVPDEVIVAMLVDAVRALPSERGLLLDGFPRTRAQAETLEAALAELDRGVDVVLDIRVPDDVIIERLSGRWICRTCQTPYNVNTRPPKTPGTCDLDGGELFQRSDDTSDAVATRLEVYRTQTEPVAAFYEQRGCLVRIDGNHPADDVRGALDEAIGAVRA